MKKNIVLSGSMRSGTTLTAAILNAHPEISLASDKLTWYFKYCCNQYGPMNTISQLESALYSIEPYMKHHSNNFTTDDVLLKIRSKKKISYESLYESLIELQLGEPIKKYFGIKSTHAAYFYERILNEIPNTKIIHMVRDIHDVYYSHKKFVNKNTNGFVKKVRHKVKSAALFATKLLEGRDYSLTERYITQYHFKYPEKIIDYWYSSNVCALDLQTKQPNNVLVIKYEDLINDVESEMAKIISFIGAKWNNEFFSYDNLTNNKNEKWVANSSFKSEQTGYQKGNIGRGKQNITEEDKRYIDLTCNELLQFFGY